MSIADLTGPFAGQGWLQLGELGLAFLLSSLIGLERQLRGKSAGLRTQAIVGTTAALMLIISKYGFSDVIVAGHIVLDPSRVAAQIVSGVGFLGAGLILTRRGAVRGLTTAAAVWETAAIGMAAGAGLWVLAIAVTALHFVIAYGYTAIIRGIRASRDTGADVELSYEEKHGVLRLALAAVTTAGWRVTGVAPRSGAAEGQSTVVMTVAGTADPQTLVSALAALDGVRGVSLLDPEDDE